jgi:glutamate N-acetyltransferase / amino-acid N-acetyltransferase
MAGHAKPSPFAPKSLVDVPALDGVRFSSHAVGIRYKGRTDVMVAVLDPGSVAAGVLTQSKTRSAAIDWCRQSLKSGGARMIVVNSGNANTFTGQAGRDAVEATARGAAAALTCSPSDVYVASTGVIGEPMDASKITAVLPEAVRTAKPGAWADAARAIMTTDTYPKLATRTATIGKTKVTLAGFCKGAGMIAPDMATMLAFMFTDAAIAQPVLQRLLSAHVETTFNSMTVDSDTSTSDTCLLFATGAAEKRGQAPVLDAADPRLHDFEAKLHDLMRDLAMQIAKDGEGVSKFVTVEVSGAEDFRAARTIARSIANSPLLKTALAAGDPNWGRVVMAVGKAGEAADRDKIAIWFGDTQIARAGLRAPEYVETEVAKYMAGREVTIRVDVGIGNGRATVWTCDLTHDYVSINADYRS